MPAAVASQTKTYTISKPPEYSEAEKLLPGEHTLPATWWTSQAVFDLEKRSIFNKGWLYCTHKYKFSKDGDYFLFNIMSTEFYIIRIGESSFKAYHKPSKKVDLTKPVDLVPIHTFVTDQGLIFVNFNLVKEGPIPFDEYYLGLQEEMKEYNFSDYQYYMSYELDGKFNWKTLMDGYQECYHCPTAHPGLNTAFKMNTYKVIPKTNYCRHYAEIVREDISVLKEEVDPDVESSWFAWGKSEKKLPEVRKEANPGGEFDGLWVYLYPTNGINCYSPAWYSIRVLPITPTHTVLQYDIYTKKGLAEKEKKEFVDFLQQVEIEDFDLCELTQKNLNQGVYSTGFLHPLKERGVVYYQTVVGEMVKKHFAIEKEHGKQFDPMYADGTSFASLKKETVDFSSFRSLGELPETSCPEYNWH
ncbi:Bet v1-like protein [Ascoidea rubescens DSM 1968]|uniref:Choline monooxygenase, chloroplastic n=1 Tax=Ascoidea rubescens DSM 1968 TaxID=1344418 RepID=A0A1D2VQS9_9ASCO|nr:Bet v1-like protein [Ascoidea rubescens DSM 1968]ODV63973.1 Bet v1-like protein [Ascoidea rubescens DSM 1968]